MGFALESPSALASAGVDVICPSGDSVSQYHCAFAVPYLHEVCYLCSHKRPPVLSQHALQQLREVPGQKTELELLHGAPVYVLRRENRELGLQRGQRCLIQGPFRFDRVSLFYDGAYDTASAFLIGGPHDLEEGIRLGRILIRRAT